MSKLANLVCCMYMVSSTVVYNPGAAVMSNNLNNNVTSNEVTSSILMMQPTTREAKEESDVSQEIMSRANMISLIEAKIKRKAIEEQERIEAERRDHKPYGQVVTDNARFRTEPNYESEVITLLKTGMTFDIVERQANWLKIKHNDQEGFIDMSLIEQYEENPPYDLYVPTPVYDENADGIPHFNPYNLRELSNLSERQIYNMLEGSALQTLSRAYYYYEKEYNVNAIFLIALNSEESGHGRSSLAISHNNLGGVRNRNGSWAYFSDWGDSLKYIANLIDTMYLDPNGAYYYGESIWNVNTKYCEGNQWATNLINIANELMRKLN